ncbi:tautomerase family protein [Streptomyces sp. NPDC056190]|uniref:tautomerase family protein n=1 Tax=unclassified Streptomyces TaxID=2593676 RepID=UPI0035E006A6
MPCTRLRYLNRICSRSRTRSTPTSSVLCGSRQHSPRCYCEFHVDETPRDLWMTDGIAPPPPGSEAEKLWVQENRPVPY